jgi:TPR repeat protein
MYEWGDGGPQDYKLAFFWYTKAAEQGNFLAKEDRDKMLEMMSQSQEEQKEKAGQAAITRMEKEGLAREEAEGITSIQSFQLYQPKANQGDADAQFNLALLYNRGVGTPQDTKQAVYWYTKAAEQGRVNAQYNLGSLYQFDGSGGVPQDFKQAVYWYTKAAEQGHVNAQYNLGRLYRFGGGDEVPQDFKQSVYWLTKAAEQGHGNAQYRLGNMYQYGDEVPQDYQQSFSWYTKAAEQDHYFAKKNRDKMLEMMSQSQEEQKEKTRQAAIARMEREGLAREEAERREVERKRQAELARLERETKERLAKEEAERRENINRKWIPFLRTIEGNIWRKSRGIPCKLGKDLYVCLQNNDQDDITTENIKNKIIEAKQKEGRSVDLFYTHQIPKASSITVAIYFKVNGNTLNVNSKQTCSGIFCGDREDSLFTVSLPYNEGPF